VSFISFLKKLGVIIANVTGTVAGLGPLIQPLVGTNGHVATAINDFTSIGRIITQVEAIGVSTGLTGAQKLAAATPLVASIVQTSEMLSGKKVADSPLFIKGCQQIVGGVVDILNSIHEETP